MTDTSQQAGALARFRRWRRSRPFWAGAWTVVGALVILAIPLLPVSDVVSAAIAGASSVLVGVLILVMGLFIWFSPANRMLAGVLAMIFSVASLVLSNLGGLVVGMICGIVGGALAVAWTDKPRPPKHGSRSADPETTDETDTFDSSADTGAGADPAEPRSVEPGATDSGSAEPLTVKPHAAEPHSAELRTTEAHSVAPRSAEPQSANLGSAEPQSANLGSTEPHSVKRRAAEPGSVEPDSVEPWSADPDSAKPYSIQPHLMELCSMKPCFVDLRFAEPRSAEPRSSESRSAEPGIAESVVAESRSVEPRSAAAGPASPAPSRRPRPPVARLPLLAQPSRSGLARRLAPRSAIVAVVAALAVPLAPPASAAPEATSCVGFDQLIALPAKALAAVPVPVLAQLPIEYLGRLPVQVLALLPVDVLATLPGQVLAQLPADLTRLIPGGLPLIGGLFPPATATGQRPAPTGCPAGQLPIPAALPPASPVLPVLPVLPSVPGPSTAAPQRPAPSLPGTEPPSAKPVSPGSDQRDELLAGRAQVSADALAVAAGTVAPTVGSKLRMADLTIRGLVYQGLVDVPTATGSKRIMRFTIDEIDANGLTLDLPLPGGEVLGLRHTLDRHVIGKQVVLDCTRLRLRVLGLLDLDFDLNGFVPPPGLALPIELPTENVDIDLVTLTLATLSVPTADAVVGRPVSTGTTAGAAD